MKRRDLIKMVALTTGTMLSAPLINSLLVSCKDVSSISDHDYVLRFFNAEEFRFMKGLIDDILPKTDSPAATEVGVHKTIDTMLGTVYKPEDRSAYKERFIELKNYMESNSNNSLELFKRITTMSHDDEKKIALKDLKQQVVAYYLRTEEVAKNHLNYLPIPGTYEPCISLDEVDGKAWAL